MVAFLVCLALIFYILGGYPLLVGVLAKRYPRPVQTGDELRSVGIVIPVHNGAHLLRRKLESILKLDYPPELIEILVVSDGSTDNFREVALDFAASGAKLLHIPRSGKAAALNAAVPRLSSEILVLTDVRQELAPESIRKLIRGFHDREVGVISGELVIRQGSTLGEASVGLYWRYESFIRNCLSKIDSMFGATGPFYALRRDLYSPIPEDILLDDVYLPMTAFFRGYRLVVDREAIAYDFPMTPEREFHRKVRTQGGNYQILFRMPQLLTRRNRMWWHYWSYKVGRLMLPWLLLALTCFSFGLKRPWREYQIALELLLLTLAAIDGLLPQSTLIKRLSSPARTFLVLMLATVQGLKVLFVAPRTLWKVTDIPGDV